MNRAAVAPLVEPVTSPSEGRDHLFISYAWEDGALAEWLTLRLTAEGYLVWCDRFKILGGESWPTDIDEAIKNKTFRLLQLVSANSLHKDNPVKERQLALALQKERKQELYVPLNIDGTKTTDLNWQISDLAFIPFEDWGSGLRQLLKKLSKVNAPRPRGESGRGVVASTLMAPAVVLQEQERTHSNWYPFLSIPSVVQRFTTTLAEARRVSEGLRDIWSFRQTEEGTFVSFTRPPEGNPLSALLRKAGGASWKDLDKVDEVVSEYLAIELLNKALLIRCRSLGLKQVEGRSTVYFPPGVVEGDRLRFALPNGQKSRVRVTGRRRAGEGHFVYLLAFEPRVRRGSGDAFVVQLKLKLHITDDAGNWIPGKRAFRRGVRVRRGWWNRQQLLRQAAIIQFLSGGAEVVPVLEAPEAISFSRTALTLDIPVRIDEQSKALSGEDFEPLADDPEDGSAPSDEGGA